MRSVWNGTIRLGLANIPVKAYGATEERGTGLHHVHVTDGGRVRHRRVCEVDGEEVDLSELARGYVLPGGETVVLTDDDLSGLPLSTSRAMDVQAFAQVEEIDPIYFARTYHLEPDPAGVKAYVLLAEALRRSGRVAVVKIALRQRESLGVVRVRDQVLVLETMLWPEEVRTPDFPFLYQDVEVSEREIRDATELVEGLSEKFTPAHYSDGYRVALRALVQSKIDGNEMVQPAAETQREGAADLLSALRTTLADKRMPRQRVEEARAAEAAAEKAKETARKAARKSRETTKS
ncbi:non-homologous end joining protein Ku [Actinophytocola algeriensis]|uniref:Non-homologous end joining protein Ku n=1 Tax=Actinophytocola algeriensis TaxID=1768010 RepID=A0A7W7Q6P3_9PSEU|nr:Ku protein [Actinophytocola algeriensis]MBB4907848.1 DNA end-binding protein Ku [Actinophytocola algeriensis]MBE1479878.1 DNA end-binding protein Ku [Actinophytocola algeriensis]